MSWTTSNTLRLAIRSGASQSVLRSQAPGTKGHAVWVEGYESICAGLISGSALVGIGNAIVNVLL
jgi:hypothetical protein